MSIYIAHRRKKRLFSVPLLMWYLTVN